MSARARRLSNFDTPRHALSQTVPRRRSEDAQRWRVDLQRADPPLQTGDSHVDPLLYLAEAGAQLSPPLAVHFVSRTEQHITRYPPGLRLHLHAGEGDARCVVPFGVPKRAGDGVWLLEAVLPRPGFHLLCVECWAAPGLVFRTQVPVDVYPPRPSGVTFGAWRLVNRLADKVRSAGGTTAGGVLAGLSALRAQGCFPALLRHARDEPRLRWLPAMLAQHGRLVAHTLNGEGLQLPQVPPELRRAPRERTDVAAGAQR